MPDHRSSAYLTSATGGRPRELFRTARLNAVGWAAVGGLCLTGAGTGLAVARLTGAPSWLTAPAGGAAAFVALLAVDRRKWAGMPTSYTWFTGPADLQRFAVLLRRSGAEAYLDTEDAEQPTLHYRNRDQRRVARAFRAAGLPPPPGN